MGKSGSVEVNIAPSPIEMAAPSPAAGAAGASSPTSPTSAASPFPAAHDRHFQQSSAPSATTGRSAEGWASNDSSRESLPRRLSKTFQESELPHGFLTATADLSSSVFAAATRSRSGTNRTRSSTTSDGTTADGVRPPGGPRPRTGTGLGSRAEEAGLGTLQENQQPAVSFDGTRDRKEGSGSTTKSEDGTVVEARVSTPWAKDAAGVLANTGDGADGAARNPNDPLFQDYDNGYHFPPRYSGGESTKHAMVAFWKYTTTPVGFLVVLYGLNVVAWGGMLFLLLCNASPAMCRPSCNDINSPRRKWIEVDSQILNGLFCVTGFGLAPWRFRDLYYLLKFRLGHDYLALRRLAGIHRSWLRLPGSEHLPVDVGPGHVPADTPEAAIPFPPTKIPDAPLTAQRAPPTKLWKLDFVLWMNIGNTFLQCVLCGFMWGMNRYRRPSWSTGLFVALGCMAGAIGGLGTFVEGKRCKSIEGVPLTPEDYAKLAADRQAGIYHYNNIKGKKPKDKAGDEEAVPLEALPPQ